MTVKLRLQKDGRATMAGKRYALVNRDSNELVSVHDTQAAGGNAEATIRGVSARSEAFGYSAAELSEICATVCERVFPGRNFDALRNPAEQSKLIRAVRHELKSRQR